MTRAMYYIAPVVFFAVEAIYSVPHLADCLAMNFSIMYVPPLGLVCAESVSHISPGVRPVQHLRHHLQRRDEKQFSASHIRISDQGGSIPRHIREDLFPDGALRGLRHRHHRLPQGQGGGVHGAPARLHLLRISLRTQSDATTPQERIMISWPYLLGCRIRTSMLRSHCHQVQSTSAREFEEEQSPRQAMISAQSQY